MKFHRWLLGLAFAVGSVSAAEVSLHAFQKMSIERHYGSEGVVFGDLHSDGTPDEVYGPYWWEGPDFVKRQEVHPPTRIFRMKWKDGSEQVLIDGGRAEGHRHGQVLLVARTEGIPGRAAAGSTLLVHAGA